MKVVIGRREYEILRSMRYDRPRKIGHILLDAAKLEVMQEGVSADDAMEYIITPNRSYCWWRKDSYYSINRLLKKELIERVQTGLYKRVPYEFEVILRNQ